MTQKISMDKKYKTRDGRDVRILCVDAARRQPVVGLISGGEITAWSIDGSCHPLPGYQDAYDLVEVKPERTLYLNMYPCDYVGGYYLSRQDADMCACAHRIACVKLTYREGQFDE